MAGQNSDKDIKARALIRKATISFPVFLFVVFFSNSIQAQNKEFGIGLGGLSYTGDLNRNYDITLNRPAFMFFMRRNITNPVSIRYGLTMGRIVGNDDDPVDIAAQLRDASFDIFIVEFSAVVEYYFLDFKSRDSRRDWSPYFFIGFGVFRSFGNEPKPADYSSVQPNIPFGVGLKYVLNPKFNLGFEFGARKLFFDYLDNISGGDVSNRNFQYGNEHDKDWYYLVGFTFSYTINTIPCLYEFY